MKYKFENHKAELINPKIEKLSSSFSVGDDFVKVSAVLSTESGKLYGVELGQMPNSDNWTDEDLNNFAAEALETFKV